MHSVTASRPLTIRFARQLSYADLLANGPFKGQEKALRALEQAEVIMVIHKEGRGACHIIACLGVRH